MNKPCVAPRFDYCEVCTILAALRVFQAHNLTDYVPNDSGTRIRDMEDFEDCEPLNGDEMDALWERIGMPPAV
jgi:hypothetical protein